MHVRPQKTHLKAYAVVDHVDCCGHVGVPVLRCDQEGDAEHVFPNPATRSEAVVVVCVESSGHVAGYDNAQHAHCGPPVCLFSRTVGFITPFS